MTSSFAEALKSSKQLLVADCGRGMAAALVAKVFADLGAQVVRFESAEGDPFYDVYPAYRAWHAGARRGERTEREKMIGQADVCIVGGESFPGLAVEQDACILYQCHDTLVVLDMGGGGASPEADILAQARTGMVHEQFSDRAMYFATALPTYGAALLGLLGAWTALLRRQTTGKGELVRCTLDQGAGLFWAPFWMQAEAPDQSFATITPKDARHLIFRCLDGGFIQLALGSQGAVAKLYKVLGISAYVDPADRGSPKLGGAAANYFGDMALIGERVAVFPRKALLDLMWEAGLAAEPVLAPGECWQDAQVLASGLIQRRGAGEQHLALPFALTPISPSVAAPPAPPRSVGQGNLPLAGLRIIDIGDFVAGPFASRLLGDLGAEVIKLQPPSGSSTISGARTIYNSNCNKRAVCVDLKTSEGMELLHRLCASADAIHHNFRVGAAERLGVAPAQLRERHPGLVGLQVSAYGQVGPKRLLSGFDMVMQALCGHEMRAGGKGNDPLWTRTPMVDYTAGALGAIATLIALHDRNAGKPADASASLLGAAMFLQSDLHFGPHGVVQGAPLLDQNQTGFHPAESLYKAQDGWIAIAARDDAMAGRLITVLGLTYSNASMPPRAHWGDQERASIASRIAQWPSGVLVDALRAAQVWVEPCATEGWRRLETPHAGVLGACLEHLPDPRYGRVSGLLGTLVEFAGGRPDSRHLRAAPSLGLHTRELMRELGYTAQDISRLIRARIVTAAI